MIPKQITAPTERSFDVSIQDVERVLDKDYVEAGSVDRAVNRLKEILDNLKK